jgi:hypothetical protein
VIGAVEQTALSKTPTPDVLATSTRLGAVAGVTRLAFDLAGN